MESLPDNATIGELYGPAMEIETESEALQYYDLLVERRMRVSGFSRDQAESCEKSSLGYYAGYYTNETRLRVEKLFNCSHPVLGKATLEPIDPAVAFSLGYARGLQMKVKE